MEITNNLNLPNAIVEAVKNDDYTRGKSDISVTQLIDPPRKATLIERHGEDIVEDASDRLWALYGQLIHGLLERADTGSVTEQRLYITILGCVIGGQMDRLGIGEGKNDEAVILEDYKFTTAYSVKNGKPKQEWIEQMNCYAQILRANGFEVEAVRVMAIFRDWSKMKARREKDYPQKQVKIIDIPMWTEEKTLAYMKERVALHQAAQKSLPECSEKERWAKPTKYAVMKEGRKSALRVLFSEAEAKEWCRGKGHINDMGKLRPDIYIEVRPGKSTRCEFYCAAADFCQQFKALKADEEED